MQPLQHLLELVAVFPQIVQQPGGASGSSENLISGTNLTSEILSASGHPFQVRSQFLAITQVRLDPRMGIDRSEKMVVVQFALAIP